MSRIFILLLLMLCSNTVSAVPLNLKTAIDSLDWYVENHQIFLNRQMSKADSLKIRLNLSTSTDEAIDLYVRIADIYRHSNMDSAQLYVKRGIDLAQNANNKPAMWRLQSSYSAMLPVGGIIYEAIKMYNGVPVDSLSPTQKAHYYKEGNRLYNYALSFYANREYINVYYDKVISVTDSLLKYLDPYSREYHLYKGEQNFFMGNNTMAYSELTELAKQLDISDPMYAHVTSMIAYYFKLRDDEEESLYYYTLSAISDLASGNREYTSLQKVGEELYKQGDVARAAKYLQLSLDDASGSGSYIRTIDAAKTIPMIYDSMARKNHRKMILLCLVIALLVAAVAYFVYKFLNINKALHRSRANYSLITTVNSKRRVFSASMLAIIADEVAKIEESNRAVSRKIIAKAYTDAYDYTSSAKSVAEGRAIFAEKFDEAFLQMCPNFREKLNDLLVPDKRFAIAETFSPEQRIMALVALGMNETQDIAQLLGLSVNTVYTYRNKVRSRAINRDAFEADLIKLVE